MFPALRVALTIAGAFWTLAGAAGPAVQWKAPAACPSPAQGRSMIEANLGASLGTIETDAEFTVILSESTRGWFAQIDTGPGATSPSRTLPAVDSCAEASEAAALVVAIALDPTATAQGEPNAEPVEPDPEPVLIPQPEPEPLPELEPLPEPEPLPERSPESVPPSRPPEAVEPLVLGGHLGLASGVRYGSLDRALGILSLRGGLLLPRARISLEAVLAPRRTVAIDDAAQVRFTQWGLAAAGCWRVPIGSTLGLEPCGALELGQTWSITRGLENAQAQSPIWVGLRAGPHLTWGFSRRAGLWTGVEALVPLTRTTFEVGGADTVARVLPIGIHAFAGVEIRLGKAL